MQTLLIKDSDFVLKHYTEQAKALNLFFKESGAKNIPNSKIKFGGGTALAIYYFQHRLSFDIDLFVSDIQYLDFVRPKIWIEESTHFNSNEYIDQHNHIGLVTSNEIKVDILVDCNSLKGFVDTSKQIVDFDLYVEDISDIIAKKITFRKQDNKTRDIIDIAVSLVNNPKLFNELLEFRKIEKDDLKILKNSLMSLNEKRFYSQLDIVQPFETYREISQKAPRFIISEIKKLEL